MIWLLLAILLLCSASVSASETALFALNRRTLNEFRESTNRARRRVHALMLRPRRVLTAMLLSNTAVNVAIFAVSLVALERAGATHPGTVALGGVGVLLAVIVGGEMIPKAMALSSARALSPAAGLLISTIQIVLAPLLWLLGALVVRPITRLVAPTPTGPDPVSTEELRLLVEQSGTEGVINPHELEMLQGIVAMGEATVREVMKPRVDVQWVRQDDPPIRVREFMVRSRKRLLPVCGRDLDDIRGVLLTRDVLLHPGLAIRDLLKPVDYVPEQIKLTHLLRHFRERPVRFAVVVDEYGGTAGVVSLKDVAEFIVGDLEESDASGELPQTRRLGPNTYRVAGSLSTRDWASRFNMGFVGRDIDTVAGLILAGVGRAPRVGDSVRLGNLTLTVETVRARRIESVILKRDDAAPGAEEPKP